MLLYRFDNAEKYPVLESRTTAHGEVTVRAHPPPADGDQATLRITVPPQPTDLVEPTVVLAMPLRAIDGKPRQFLLDVYGDASSCRIWLEAGDATGVGLVYGLGTIHFAGWGTCTADATQPSERWGPQQHEGPTGVTLPLHLYRLGFALGANREGLDIRLKTLSASGELRFAPSGIA